MIGIDTSRVKRWFKKTYTQFNDIDHDVELMVLSAESVDHIGGMDATFQVDVYDKTPTKVFECQGVYNRMHYGGWNCHETSTSTGPFVG